MFENTIVRFVYAGSESRFVFHPVFLKEYSVLHKDIAPYGFKSSYDQDTEMFCFLDSLISPSCLEEIFITSRGDVFETILVYRIDHIPQGDIERFFVPLDEDDFF